MLKPGTAAVLITTVLVAVSGSGRTAAARSNEPISSSAAGNRQPAKAEAPTTDDVQAAEREYKGDLDPVGPFRLRDLHGRLWTEGDFRGKVLIAVQWAAWCGPCVSEFPQVQKLYEAVRSDPSIAFASFDMDRDPTKIRSFLEEFRKEYSFPVLFAGARFKIHALPCTWIVDRDGYIREVLFGSGVGWFDQVRALADAVKQKPPVSSLPSEVRKAKREQNEREGLESR